MVEKEKKRTSGCSGCWLVPVILLFAFALFFWVVGLNAVLNDRFGGELVRARGDLNQDSIALLVISIIILVCGFLSNKYYEKEHGLKIKELKKLIKAGKYSESWSQVNKTTAPGRLTISPFDKNAIRRGFKAALALSLVGILASAPGVFPDLLKGGAGSNLGACPDQIKSGTVKVKTCYSSKKKGSSTWCDTFVPSKVGEVTYDSHGVRLESSGYGEGWIPDACLDELGIPH
jgi:hypothetical protein